MAEFEVSIETAIKFGLIAEKFANAEEAVWYTPDGHKQLNDATEGAMTALGYPDCEWWQESVQDYADEFDYYVLDEQVW